MNLVHEQKQKTAEVYAPHASSYEYSISFGKPRQTKGKVYTSPTEIKHLLPAALLIVGIGFSIALYNDFFYWYGWTWTIAAVFSLLLTASFLTHEMAHKVAAQKSGLWAEFRLITWGAVLTLISVFTPFRLIAPGAVMIAGPARPDDVGKISIAGPITNISLSLVFLCVAYTPIPASYAIMFLILASFNAFIALFNLIPFGVLDGLKIFSWNKKVWALAFAASAALTAYTYLFA
jgi:Zn-dependent protease